MNGKTIQLSELFVSLCFLAFLFGTMVVTVAKYREADAFYENRSLAAMPEYTAEADGNGSYVKDLDKFIVDRAALRTALLKWKTGLDLALGRPAVNDTVISGGWFLPYLGYPQVDREEAAAGAELMADNLVRIRDAAAEYGGQYCYVAVPNQYVYGAEAYPSYMDSRFQKQHLNVELLSAALAERGVDFLDVGAEVEALGRPEGFMSKVDHHYTMEGAFLTYRLLMDKLAAMAGEELLILGEEDVTFETLPNTYLGSRARKLMGMVPSEEKLQLLWPKEEVPFTRWDNGAEDLPQVYSMPDSAEEYATYGVYMGGDIAHTTIDTNRQELPSILVYGDSFTNALECILYLSFDRMDALDLRHYNEMSLTDYIREAQPDYVVCVRDYDALLLLSENGAGEDLIP